MRSLGRKPDTVNVTSWEIEYDGARIPAGVRQGEIFIGKQYPSARNPDTEVDVSIEGPGVLVFIEAKLYSTISQAP